MLILKESEAPEDSKAMEMERAIAARWAEPSLEGEDQASLLPEGTLRTRLESVVLREVTESCDGVESEFNIVNPGCQGHLADRTMVRFPSIGGLDWWFGDLKRLETTP